MKKLLLVAVIFTLFLTLGPIPAQAQEELCIGGVPEALMARGDTLYLCFGVHPDPQVLGHEIYMRMEGQAYDYHGDHTKVMNDECTDGECNAPITIDTNGVYYFNTIAFGAAFLRSGPGNEVKLTVRDPLPPGSGCSITQ